jgi:hypothetical protein
MPGMTSAMSTGEPSRAASATVWAIAGLTVVLIGVVVWSEYEMGELSTDVSSLLIGLAYLISLLSFVVSGALIASRQPGNIIGWLLIVPGLSASLSEVLNNWLLSLDPAGATANPAVWLSLWFTNWSWVLLIYPIFHLLLVFPDGALLSPRWRWVVALEVVMVGFMVGSATFADELALITEEDETLWSIANPIGFLPDSFYQGVFGTVWTVGLLLLTVAGVVAVVLRFRSGTTVQRQQLKWPLFGVALFGISYGATAVTSGAATGTGWDALFGLSLAAIPVSIAIAVLKYRLYDLDRIVSRTVTYALVAALLVAAYGLIVLGLGSFLGRDNPLAIAAATLAAAALFNPLRTRIRGWVDRRFNRSRYDAERVIEGFVSSMRDRVDPDGLVEGWIGVATETMQPTAVGAWVRS